MVSNYLGADSWLWAEQSKKLEFDVSSVNETAFLTFKIDNSQVRISFRKTDLPELVKKIENFLADN